MDTLVVWALTALGNDPFWALTSATACVTPYESEVLAFERRVKREAGENPARSRHCKQRAAGVKPLFFLGMGRLPESR
jgi:hypothetical protein